MILTIDAGGTVVFEYTSGLNPSLMETLVNNYVNHLSSVAATTV
jgi:hypothetical protein